MNQLAKRATAILCALALFSTVASAAEMIPPRGTVHGSLWIEQGILVNGVELGVVSDTTQYGELPVIGGTVYIPLRTAEELLGTETAWDEAAAVLSLTRTKKPYVRERRIDITRVEQTQEELEAESQQLRQDVLMGIDVEPRPDVTLLVDGMKQELTNAQGEAVYPILFRDVLYLPVRSVGKLCGMEVAWLADEPVIFSKQTQHSFNQLYEPYVPVGRGAQIHLYDTPTEAQLKSVRDYLNMANQLYMQCVDATAAFPEPAACTKKQAIDQLEVIASYGEQLRTLSAPDAPFFAWEARRISAYGWDVQVYRAEDYITKLEAGTSSVERILSGFKDNYMLTSLYTLRGQLEEGQRLLDAVQTNAYPQNSKGETYGNNSMRQALGLWPGGQCYWRISGYQLIER